MKKKDERLVASAIKFRIITEDNQIDEYESIVTGKRHADVFRKMKDLGISYCRQSYTEGFWTSNSRFVNRKEALIIAINANQLIEPKPLMSKDSDIELFSEDVW